MPGTEGNGYVLFEIWETRCDKPRVDGVVIKEYGLVVKIQNLERWLGVNELSSDIDAEFDLGFYQA